MQSVSDSEWEEQAIREEMRRTGHSGRQLKAGDFDEDYLDLEGIKEEKSRQRHRWSDDELV